MRPTLLIIDDHAAFRRAAMALLDMGGFSVAGEAENGSLGLAAADELHPDVVLVDVQMPGLDGFAVAQRLKARDSRTAVVLTSSRSRAEYAPKIDASPANGFLEKRDLTAERLAAIAEVTV